MDPSRWRRLEALFLQLEDLDLRARGALLDRECGDDADLRRQLEGMLQELDGGDEDWIVESIKEVLPRNLDRVPTRLGRYRITGEIGRGGLSTVLSAERDDREYSQRVAIKLIRRGLDTDDILLRLRQERQILARLQHPNIAQLIDGGSTEDGRPYVVMEHIEGRPIDDFCRDLPLNERLELFVIVCEAVQYAHRNLVIHRDIKPANILVTEDGQPKLLDFGIAKLIQPGLYGPDNAAHTAPGRQLLTPEYASPEQIRGEPLTTASDVYALGVLLFELLTDERPFDLRKEDLRGWEEAICERGPPRPSSRLRNLAQTDDGDRRSVARQVRAMTGDLDNIVLMALRKEPERRYASVEQMADDVRRHLEDLPVRARADTLAYRLSKFVKRNRFPVAIASLSAVLLIAISLVALRQAQLANRGRLASEQLSELMVDLFEMPDPGEARGNTVTAREILDRGAAKIPAELQGQPEVQALFLATIGRVYKNLGLYQRAGEVLGEAVDLRRQDAPLARAASQSHLGEIRYLQGDFDQAQTLFEESLRLRLRVLGEDHLELAESYSNLGAISFVRREFDTAESLWTRALEIRQRHQGDHGDVAELHDNLAALREVQGRTAEAERHLRQALDLHARHHGEAHHETLRTVANLAALLHKSDDLSAAEPLYRRALAGQIEVLGKDHPQVARSSSNLAALLTSSGQLDEAEALLTDALKIQRQRLGEGHFETTYPMIHLADVLAHRGEASYDEAEALYREVHRIRSASLPQAHAHQINPLLGLGRLQLERQHHRQAAETLETVAELCLRIHGEQHDLTLEVQDLLRQARAAETP
ncbi:MAG: serine/threonine-protein kinase [Acidobacteriota bacterium]